MQLLERIIQIAAPFDCLGCGYESGRLLCESCLQSVPTVPSRCYRCKAVTNNYETCLTCLKRTTLGQVVTFAHHNSLAKELIHHMKYERAQAGVTEAARLLATQLPYLDGQPVLVHVPTATSRVRLRGYDHAQLLAKELSKQSGWPRLALLARVGQAHQVGASRAKRLEQLQGAFRPVRQRFIQNAHVVLVDDVLTTGATLETAARELKRAGAKRVDAIVFAQA